MSKDPRAGLREQNLVAHPFRNAVLDRYGVEYEDFDRRYFDEPTATGFAGYRDDGNGAEGERDFAAEARRIAALPGVRTVLDVGCAKGFLVREVRRLGVEAWGIDLSSYAVSCADPETRAWLEVRSLSRLGRRRRCYDLCHVCGVLVYLDLSEIRAALRVLHSISRVGAVFFEPPLESLLELYERGDLRAIDPLRKQELPRAVWQSLYREAGFEPTGGEDCYRRIELARRPSPRRLIAVAERGDRLAPGSAFPLADPLAGG